MLTAPLAQGSQETIMQRKHNKCIVPLARALRKEMTLEERHLWYDFLRSYPVRFQRQKVLGNYIADFYCAKAKLVIELDGSGHYTPCGRAHDEKRPDFLAGYDIKVVRILNSEVTKNFLGVCQHIDKLVNQALDKSATK